MEIPLYNQKAESVGKVELPDDIFNLASNNDLLVQVTNSQRSNRRQVIAHAKGRSEVRGGGKKPWRQKGTGRARHGSIRSPIWKGGGVTFGPTKERNFEKKVNKKMAKKAMFVALSSKVKDNQIIVLDQLSLSNYKTKEMASIFKNVSKLFSDKRISNTLLVTPTVDNNIKISSKNIPKLFTMEARNLNALDILNHKNLLIVKDTIEVLKNFKF